MVGDALLIEWLPDSDSGKENEKIIYIGGSGLVYIIHTSKHVSESKHV